MYSGYLRLDGASGLSLTILREVLIGITGRDFTLIAASKAATRGASILKTTDNKTRILNKNTLMAFSGEAGDTSKITSRGEGHANVRSYPCRIHTSQCSALQYAKFYRSVSICCCSFCPRNSRFITPN